MLEKRPLVVNKDLNVLGGNMRLAAAQEAGFKEIWIDVRTGKPCGRRKGEKRGVPYCRPSKRVSSKTVKTASEMSASEKAAKIREKKRLGQPAGKPRRVKNVKRRKK